MQVETGVMSENTKLATIVVRVTRQDSDEWLSQYEATEIAREAVSEALEHLGDDGEYDYEVIK